MTQLNRSTASKDKELAALKLKTEQQINTLVGAVRGMYITTLPGQDLIYNAKELEGIAYLKSGTPITDLTDYPFISAEIGTTGQSAQEVAQVYLNLSQMWRALAAQLEQVRLGYTYQANAAPDAAGVTMALENCDATLGVFRRV